MAPKLYMAIISGPTRAVLMAEQALGLKFEHVPVDLFKGETRTQEYLKLNPAHTIPTLIDDDGTTICDSHAILAYLVGKYSKLDSFYPRNLTKRALVDQRMYFDAGTVFPLMKKIMTSITSGGAKNISETHRKEVQDMYEILNNFLKGNLWVAGNDITIADLSLLTSISSINLIIPIDGKYGNIISWLRRAEAQEFYEVNTKGQAVVEEIIKKMLDG